MSSAAEAIDLQNLESPATIRAVPSIFAKNSDFDEKGSCRSKWRLSEINMVNKTSVWWKYFKSYNVVVHKDESVKAICILCHKRAMDEKFTILDLKKDQNWPWEVNIGESKAPGHLKQHMDSHHPQIVQKELETKLTGNKPPGGGLGSNGTTPISQIFTGGGRAKFRDALLRWVIMCYIPLSMVENEYFRTMIRTLDSEIPHICSRTMGELISAKEVLVRHDVVELLKGQFIALTTDHWTSAGHENYMSLTAHFINELWIYTSIVLECAKYSSTHEATSIVEGVLALMKKNKEIPVSSVVCIVTDTAPNMNAAANMYPFPWHGCVAHLLQLTTDKAFNGPGIAVHMSNIRGAVGYFKTSTQAAKALSLVQTALRMDVLSVVQDVVTRWWSTQAMVERITEIKPSVIAVLGAESATAAAVKARLSEQDWLVAEQLSVALRPFKQFQLFMEGSNYVTLSLVPFMVHSIRQALLEAPPAIADTVAALTNSFREVWGSGEPGTVYDEHKTRGVRQRRKGLPRLAMVAAALDIRTKTLVGIPDEDKSKVWDEVHRLLVEIVVADSSALRAKQLEQSNAAVESDEGASDDVSTSDTQRVFRDLFAGQGATESTREQREEEERELREDAERDMKRELKRYRSASLPFKPNMTLKDAGDPLVWWKANALLYPTIARLAKRVLCIPATSAASERLFSTAGLIVTDKRNCLSDEKVSQLVFLHECLKWYEDRNNL